jgi:hypothetical protein
MIRILVAAAWLAVATASHAEPLRLATRYDDAGTNPNGSSYSGHVDVQVISDTTFTIKWTIGSVIYSGFGMHLNAMVAATYIIDGIPGLIMYQVQPNGVLSGIWAVRGREGAGTEQLTPRD